MRASGLKASEIEDVMEIDEDEPQETGQKVRKTIESADFFIRNDSDHVDQLNAPSLRFLDLIFGVGVITPTFAESAMAVARDSAAGSACLSRQVGAAVYNEKKELLGTGCNDVPKFGGGLYSESDIKDNRCFSWKGKICHNDSEKNKLAKKIFDICTDILLEDTHEDIVVKRVNKAGLGSIIEFSRAVHAEMDAIVSVARDGKGFLRKGFLFCTTFPCHNCARHIVAAGISEVYYIEPYPKSLATTLHEDAISTDLSARGHKCLFLQFEGVSPGNLVKLFATGKPRKEGGRLIIKRKVDAWPVAEMPLDSCSRREELVIHRIAQEPLKSVGSGSGGEASASPAVVVVADNREN